eukprot:scaffold3021_cov236-Pinguiococcus_pyrenoidosus.AAC.4
MASRWTARVLLWTLCVDLYTTALLTPANTTIALIGPGQGTTATRLLYQTICKQGLKVRSAANCRWPTLSSFCLRVVAWPGRARGLHSSLTPSLLLLPNLISPHLLPSHLRFSVAIGTPAATSRAMKCPSGPGTRTMRCSRRIASCRCASRMVRCRPAWSGPKQCARTGNWNLTTRGHDRRSRNAGRGLQPHGRSVDAEAQRDPRPATGLSAPAAPEGAREAGLGPLRCEGRLPCKALRDGASRARSAIPVVGPRGRRGRSNSRSSHVPRRVGPPQGLSVGHDDPRSG